MASAAPSCPPTRTRASQHVLKKQVCASLTGKDLFLKMRLHYCYHSEPIEQHPLFGVPGRLKSDTRARWATRVAVIDASGPCRIHHLDARPFFCSQEEAVLARKNYDVPELCDWKNRVPSPPAETRAHGAIFPVDVVVRIVEF